MAIVYCRECKKEVSNAAATCPHCGIADPGKGAQPKPTAKDSFLGFLILFAIVGAIVYSCSGSDSGSAEKDSTSAPAAATPAAHADAAVPAPEDAPAPSLDITPSQFRAAYNQIITATLPGNKSPFLIKSKNIITKGEVNDVFRAGLADTGFEIIGSVSKKTGKLKDLMFIIGRSDGGAADTLKTIVAISLAVKKVTDSQKLGDGVTALVHAAVKQIKNPSGTASDIAPLFDNGYKLSATGSQLTGVNIFLSKDRQ